MRMAGMSPYCWSMLRPAQPLALSALQLAAVYSLTFFGAFCAALVATSYMQQAAPWQVQYFCMQETLTAPVSPSTPVEQHPSPAALCISQLTSPALPS